MNISAKLAGAAIFAAQQHQSARIPALGHTVSEVAGLTLLIIVVAIVIFLRTMARATRSFTTLIGQFMQMATTMAKALCTMTIVVVVISVLLVHH